MVGESGLGTFGGAPLGGLLGLQQPGDDAVAREAFERVRRLGDDLSWSQVDESPFGLGQLGGNLAQQFVPMTLPSAPQPRVPKAVRCFLKNLRRIKRALENDEGWTISEARVPLWLAKEIQRHPPSSLRASDRALCKSDAMSLLLLGEELCRVHGVLIIVGSRESKIEFSYKKVA